MKEHPIIMSPPMVKAILQGRKTQTRRIMNPQPTKADIKKIKNWLDTIPGCPYGSVGDILWVRETFEIYVCNDGGDDYTQIRYVADDSIVQFSTNMRAGKHPSIHMPREACRIYLKNLGVRAERLQSISKSDAIAEGIEPEPTGDDLYKNYNEIGYRWIKAKTSYHTLWQSIHGVKSWGENPWVWVIKFKLML